MILIDVSTSYVDHLQSKPSAPPTPIASVQPSRPASLTPLSKSISYENVPRSTISQPQQTTPTNTGPLNTESALGTETTPLLLSTRSVTGELRREASAPDIYLATKSSHSRDHSPCHCHHRVHHICTPIIPPTVTGVPIDVLTNSPRIFRQLGMSHPHSHGHVGHGQANERDHHHHDEHEHLRVRRRRQIVGLLVSALTSI